MSELGGSTYHKAPDSKIFCAAISVIILDDHVDYYKRSMMYEHNARSGGTPAELLERMV